MFNDTMIVREKQKLGTANEHRKSVFNIAAEVSKGRRSFLGPLPPEGRSSFMLAGGISTTVGGNVTFVGLGSSTNAPGGGSGLSGSPLLGASGSPTISSRKRKSIAKGGASDFFSVDTIVVTNPDNETFNPIALGSPLNKSAMVNKRGIAGGGILKTGGGSSFSGDTAATSPTRRNGSLLKYAPNTARGTSPLKAGGDGGEGSSPSNTTGCSNAAEVRKSSNKRRLQIFIRTIAKFNRAPQRNMVGNEWLCINNVAFETDQSTLNFLCSRLLSLDSLQASFRKQISTKRSQFGTFTSNVVTLFSLSGLSLSGVNLRGVDMSNVNLDGACLFGADLRQTRWNHASAVLSNLENSDFTAAHGTIVTEPLLMQLASMEDQKQQNRPRAASSSAATTLARNNSKVRSAALYSQRRSNSAGEASSRTARTNITILSSVAGPSANNSNSGAVHQFASPIAASSSPPRAVNFNSLLKRGLAGGLSPLSPSAARAAAGGLLPSLSPAMADHIASFTTPPEATTFSFEPESPDMVAIGSDQGHIIIYDLETCTVKQKGRQPANGGVGIGAGTATSAAPAASPIRQLSYNSEGDLLLSFASGGDTIYVWRTVPALGVACILTQGPADGRLRRLAKGPASPHQSQQQHHGPIVAAYFGIDSSFVVAATAFGSVLHWRIDVPPLPEGVHLRNSADNNDGDGVSPSGPWGDNVSTIAPDASENSPSSLPPLINPALVGSNEATADATAAAASTSAGTSAALLSPRSNYHHRLQLSEQTQHRLFPLRTTTVSDPQLLYSHGAPITAFMYDRLTNQCALIDSNKHVTVRSVGRNATICAFSASREAVVAAAAAHVATKSARRLVEKDENKKGDEGEVSFRERSYKKNNIAVGDSGGSFDQGIVTLANAASSHSAPADQLRQQKNQSLLSANSLHGNASMSLTPSGTRIAVATSTVRITLFDIHTQEALVSMRLSGTAAAAASSASAGAGGNGEAAAHEPPHSISFTRDETFMVAAEGERWYLWHVPKGKLLFVFDASNESMLGIMTPRLPSNGAPPSSSASALSPMRHHHHHPSALLLRPVRKITSVNIDCFAMNITFTLSGSLSVHSLPLLYCLSPARFQSDVRRLAAEAAERNFTADNVLTTAEAATDQMGGMFGIGGSGAPFSFAGLKKSAASIGIGGRAHENANSEAANALRRSSHRNSIANSTSSSKDRRASSTTPQGTALNSNNNNKVAEKDTAGPAITKNTLGVRLENPHLTPDEVTFVTLGDDGHTIVTVSKRGVVTAHDSVTGKRVYSCSIPQPPSATTAPFSPVAFVTSCLNSRIAVVRDNSAYLVSYAGAGMVTVTMPKKRITAACFFATPPGSGASASASPPPSVDGKKVASSSTTPQSTLSLPLAATGTGKGMLGTSPLISPLSGGASAAGGSKSPLASARGFNTPKSGPPILGLVGGTKKSAANTPSTGLLHAPGGNVERAQSPNTNASNGGGKTPNSAAAASLAIPELTEEERLRKAAHEDRRARAAASEVTHNGALFLAASGDRLIRIWRAHTGQFLTTITKDTPVISLAFCAGMSYVVAVTGFISSRNVMIELLQPKATLPTASSTPKIGAGGQQGDDDAAKGNGSSAGINPAATALLSRTTMGDTLFSSSSRGPLADLLSTSHAAVGSGANLPAPSFSEIDGGSSASPPRMQKRGSAVKIVSPRVNRGGGGEGGDANPPKPLARFDSMGIMNASLREMSSVVAANMMSNLSFAQSIVGGRDEAENSSVYSGGGGDDEAGGQQNLLGNSTSYLGQSTATNTLGSSQALNFSFSRKAGSSMKQSATAAAMASKSANQNSNNLLSPREAAGNFSGNDRRALVALIAARVSTGCGAQGIDALSFANPPHLSDNPAANRQHNKTAEGGNNIGGALAQSFLSRSQLASQQRDQLLASMSPVGAYIPRIEHLISQFVTPFLTSPLALDVIDVIGPLRVPQAESTVKTALSPDGGFLAIAYDRHAYVWNLQTHACLWGAEMPPAPPVVVWRAPTAAAKAAGGEDLRPPSNKKHPISAGVETTTKPNCSADKGSSSKQKSDAAASPFDEYRGLDFSDLPPPPQDSSSSVFDLTATPVPASNHGGGNVVVDGNSDLSKSKKTRRLSFADEAEGEPNNGGATSSSDGNLTRLVKSFVPNPDGNIIASISMSCLDNESAYIVLTTEGRYTEVVHMLSGVKIVRMNPSDSFASASTVSSCGSSSLASNPHTQLTVGAGGGENSDGENFVDGSSSAPPLHSGSTVAACGVDDYTIALLSHRGTLQSWSLRGLHCRLHNCHPVSRLTPPQLSAWLTDRGITHKWLRQRMRHLTGSDLMSEASPAAFLVKLVSMNIKDEQGAGGAGGRAGGGRASIVGLFGGRRLTGVGGGSAADDKSGGGGVKAPQLGAQRMSLQINDVTATAAIGGAQGALPSEIELPDDPSLKRNCKKLLKVLSDVARSSYHTINFTAVDDAELTLERFSEFTTENLVEFANQIFSSDLPKLALLHERNAQQKQARQDRYQRELKRKNRRSAASSVGSKAAAAGAGSEASSNSDDDVNFNVNTIAGSAATINNRSFASSSRGPTSTMDFGSGGFTADLTTPDLLAAATPQQPALAVIFQRDHCVGRELIAARTVEGLARIGSIDYLGLTFALHGEISAIRSRDTFAARSIGDVIGWAFSKRPDVRLACVLANLDGRDLLHQLDFHYRMLVPCSGCGQLITDPLARCPPRRRDHSDLKPTLEGEALSKSTAFAKLLKFRHYAECAGFAKKMESLPSATFSQGIYWHKILGDAGYAATLSFEVPKSLIRADSLQINSAQINIFGTHLPISTVPTSSAAAVSAMAKQRGGLPMIAVIPEFTNERSQTFEALTGLSSEVVLGGFIPPSDEGISPSATASPPQAIVATCLDGSTTVVAPSLDLSVPPRWTREMRTTSLHHRQSSIFGSNPAIGEDTTDANAMCTTPNSPTSAMILGGGGGKTSANDFDSGSSPSTAAKRRETNAAAASTRSRLPSVMKKSDGMENGGSSPRGIGNSPLSSELHYVLGSERNPDPSVPPASATAETDGLSSAVISGGALSPTAGRPSPLALAAIQQQQRQQSSAQNTAAPLVQRAHPTMPARHAKPLSHPAYVITRRPHVASGNGMYHISTAAVSDDAAHGGGGLGVVVDNMSFTSGSIRPEMHLPSAAAAGRASVVVGNGEKLGSSFNAAASATLNTAAGASTSNMAAIMDATLTSASVTTKDMLSAAAEQSRQRRREEREREKIAANTIAMLGRGDSTVLLTSPMPPSASEMTTFLDGNATLPSLGGGARSAARPLHTFASKPQPHHIIAPRREDSDDEFNDDDGGNSNSHRPSRYSNQQLQQQQQQVVGFAEIADIIRPLWTAESKQLRSIHSQRRASTMQRKRASSVAAGGGAAGNAPRRHSSHGGDRGGALLTPSTGFVGIGTFATSKRSSNVSIIDAGGSSNNIAGILPTAGAVGGAAATTPTPVTNIPPGGSKESTVFLRLLLVADKIPPAYTNSDLSAHPHTHPARRPQLSVNYCYTDRLCHCKSDAAPLIMDDIYASSPSASGATGDGGKIGSKTSPQQQHQAQTGGSNDSGKSPSINLSSRQQQQQQHPHSSSEFYKGNVLCDRYCNKDSTCPGHKCIRSLVQHKRAPFLVWQSTVPTATLMRGALLPPASELSHSVVACEYNEDRCGDGEECAEGWEDASGLVGMSSAKGGNSKRFSPADNMSSPHPPTLPRLRADGMSQRQQQTSRSADNALSSSHHTFGARGLPVSQSQGTSSLSATQPTSAPPQVKTSFSATVPSRFGK